MFSELGYRKNYKIKRMEDASVKEEWNFSQLDKIFALVIKYKSQVQTDLTHLENTIKLIPLVKIFVSQQHIIEGTLIWDSKFFF